MFLCVTFYFSNSSGLLQYFFCFIKERDEWSTKEQKFITKFTSLTEEHQTTIEKERVRHLAF